MLVSYPGSDLMLWAMLFSQERTPSVRAIQYCLQKRASMSACRVQGIARKLSSPPRSSINPCLTQAVMTNACWVRGAPQGTNLISCASSIYRCIITAKQCISGSQSLWGWMLGCFWWMVRAGCPSQHVYVPGRDGRSWHAVSAGHARMRRKPCEHTKCK